VDVLGYAGKRVIVTGAAEGIGAVTTRLLVDLGAEAHTLDRHKPDIGGIASFTECDLSDPEQVDRALDRIGSVVNMCFESTGLARDALVRLVDAVEPKMLEHGGSAIACVATPSVTSYVARAAVDLARAGIRFNGVALEGVASDDVAAALVLLASPLAGGLTGTCLVPAAVLPLGN
jgi:NAD(P)-dependent dehydrogenase (short-subunit alcohol dehydrogenase family)